MILGWTPLRPSTRERRLRLSALAVTLLVTCVLTIAALLTDPRHPAQLWAAVVCCAAIAAIVAARLHPRRDLLEVAVDANGLPLLRATAAVADDARDASPLARCMFAAPWLITLQCGALRAAVWPDSVPTDAFRRLHACMRWRSSAADSPPHPASMNAPSTSAMSS